MVFSRLQHGVQRALLVAACLCSVCAAAWAQDRKPVPDAAAQARAQELLRDVYGKEYDAAKTSKQKTDLARKLLDQAAKSQSDPASHFVLLRVAKDVSVLAADAETALEAVERIVTTYDVDAMEMRLDCVKGLAAAAKFSSQHGALAQQAYSLVDVALAEDNFEAAGQLGEIARASAQKARNYSLLKEVVARMKTLDELQQAHAEYQKASARLDQSPTDPEANLAAGRYLCLSRGEWERGIPMLALGSDPALKAPAVKELTGADSPDAQIALGDAWWDLGQTKEGRERDCFLLRAGHWYQKAQAKVTSGLAKVKLDQRLDEIAKIEPPAGHVAGTRPGPQGPPSAAAGVKPFDPATALLLATLQGHAGAVRSIGFSPDGKTLVSASMDRTVRFWDVARRQPSGMLPPFKNQELRAAFSPAGSLLAVANGDSTISLWNTARGQLRGTLIGHQRMVDGIAFSPDGSLLASAARDNMVILWDVNRGRITRPLGPLGGRPWSLAFSPDGSLVASGNTDGTVTLWEVTTGTLQHTLAGHRGAVRCVAFSPKGESLVSSGQDATVRLWDTRAGTLQRTLEGHVADLYAIAIGPEGTTLASTGSDGTIGLWDLATGTPHRMLAGHMGRVWSLAFSPDGSLLASAGDDHTVRLWGTDPSGRLPSTVAETTVSPGPMQPMPPPAALPDLRVTQVFLENGEKSAWIRNDGDAPAIGVGVLFTVDGEPADTYRVDVPPGEQVQATVSKLPPGRHVVGVMVDPENRIPERNETNNALQSAFTVTLTRDGRSETGERMTMPKGKVSTPGLTPDDEGWILLPPLVQRDRDTREANWKWDGQTAAFSAGRGRAYVSFPVTIVGTYELQAHVTITQARETTLIGLPIVGARAVVLDMKGDRGNSESPTATIRLKGVNPSPQPQANASMNIGTEYALSCRVAVSQAGVGVEILRDEQILFQWVGPVSQVAERRMIHPGTVELETAYYTSSKFRDLRLRMLAGQATALFPEAKTPAGETSTSSHGRPGSEAPAPSTVLWRTPPTRWGPVRAVSRFDPKTAQPGAVLQAHEGTVNTLAFSPDGAILFTGSGSEPTVGLWETASGRPRGSIGPPPESLVPGRKYNAQSLAISADGSMLAWGGGEPWTVWLWNPATGEVRQTLDKHNGQIWRVAITSDGSTAASGSNDTLIKLWNTSTGELLRSLEQGTRSVACVAFTPDGATLASSCGAGDSTVKLWDVATGELRRTLAGHRRAARCLAFSPDGSLLASGGDGGRVILHKMPPAERQRRFEGHTGGIRSLAFSPDGSLLASGSGDRTVRLWEVATGELQRTLEGFQRHPSSLAFSPDGSNLAVADGGTVKLWSAPQNRR